MRRSKDCYAASGERITCLGVLNQRQNQLRGGVGVGEDGGAGLHKHLRLREVRRFGGEIGVGDDRLSVAGVRQGRLQVVGSRLQGVGLEGPQGTAEGADLVDGGIDDRDRVLRPLVVVTLMPARLVVLGLFKPLTLVPRLLLLMF